MGKSERKGGLVWVVAAVGLALYATIGLLVTDVPGVEQLTSWLESLSEQWILLAAFIAMLVEGLYLIGSFFPGTSIVILLAVLAGTTSWSFFIILLLVIYSAWVLAGIINVVLADQFSPQTVKSESIKEDRMLETWFPAFRSNHEVAQVLSGKSRWSVFYSSLRVKLFGMLIFTVHGAIIPLFIDVTSSTNQEGFTSLYILAVVMLIVGSVQLKESKKEIAE